MRTSSIVFWVISVLLISYGVAGIGGVGYLYFGKIDDVYSTITSVADHFILASENLQNFMEMNLTMGVEESQIENVERNMEGMKNAIDNITSDIYSIASDISTLDVEPFESVEDTLIDVSNTLSIASSYLDQASETISMIRGLKIKNALPEEYIILVNTYSEQFVLYGNLLKQTTSFIPYILLYVGLSHSMFVLMGVATLIVVTKYIKRDLEAANHRVA